MEDNNFDEIYNIIYKDDITIHNKSTAKDWRDLASENDINSIISLPENINTDNNFIQRERYDKLNYHYNDTSTINLIKKTEEYNYNDNYNTIENNHEDNFSNYTYNNNNKTLNKSEKEKLLECYKSK
jgi:hypothetical protein